MVHVGANGDSKSIIQVRRLAKNYLRGNEELHVLQGIDLDIDQGARLPVAVALRDL